jgi:hypothetical protein
VHNKLRVHMLNLVSVHHGVCAKFSIDTDVVNFRIFKYPDTRTVELNDRKLAHGAREARARGFS